MAIARYPRRTWTRSSYVRTSGDLLINDGSSENGPVWWIGVDSGGGAQPIGPNGPWQSRGPSVITRATSLIAGPLTAAPYTLADQSRPDRQIASPRWVTDPMLLREDGRIGGAFPAVTRLARSVFWFDWVRSAIWVGEGPFIMAEDQYGQPLAGSLRMLNPLLLSTDRDANGALIWTIPTDDPGASPAAFDRAGYLELGPIRYRLVVLRNPHSQIDENGRSQGVFQMHPDTFQLSRQIQDYSSGTYRSGIPAGYLKVTTPDMSQPKADKLKADWLRNHGGDRRSIAVLNASTEFVPLNLSPVDAALTESVRLNIADVAFAFGLDPQALSVSLAGSMTYTNVRDAWLNHRDFGLAPWISTVQDTLSALVPASQSVLVDLDGFANPTRQERYEALKIGIEAGIITVDEARRMEGLPPMGGLPAPLQIVAGDQAQNNGSEEESA